MFPPSCKKYSEAVNTKHMIHNSAPQKMLWLTAARRRLRDRGARPGKREGVAPGCRERGWRKGIETRAMEKHGGFSRQTAKGGYKLRPAEIQRPRPTRVCGRTVAKSIALMLKEALAGERLYEQIF